MERIWTYLSPQIPINEFFSKPVTWQKICYFSRSILAPTNTSFLMASVMAFLTSFVLAPFSWGALIFLIYVIVYELVIFIICQGAQMKDPKCNRIWCDCSWNPGDRLVIILFTLLGFTLGRLLIYIDPKTKNFSLWAKCFVPAFIGALCVLALSLSNVDPSDAPPGAIASVVLVSVYLSSILFNLKLN